MFLLFLSWSNCWIDRVTSIMDCLHSQICEHECSWSSERLCQWLPTSMPAPLGLEAANMDQNTDLSYVRDSVLIALPGTQNYAGHTQIGVGDA